MDSTLLSFLVMALLILCSAFFSGSETALTAASKARMTTLANQGSKRARQVNSLREQMEKVIGTILLGNAFVNSSIAALTTAALTHRLGEQAAFYAAGAATIVIFIFGEVLPKTFAINRADRTSLALAPLVTLLVKLTYPITHVTQLLCNLVLRVFGVNVVNEPGAEERMEELRGAIELHTGAVEETREHGQMLHSILDLAEVPVADIMVHRGIVTMIDADLPAADILAAIVASPHTRIPLYRGEADNIIGVLHAKAALRAVAQNRWRLDGLDLVASAAKPWFIPDSTNLYAQLESFRARHEHFAIVVDEYGAFMGIVTLEDILEEIVGDIADEHDQKVEGVKAESDGSYVIDGAVTLRDLNREFGWKLPDEKASTLAGLVLNEARQIPQSGQIFVFYGFRFEILDRQRNQIRRLRVTPPVAESPAAESAEGAPAKSED